MEATIKKEEFIYGDELNLHGFLAYDSSKTEKVPGVIVVHDGFGHEEYCKSRAIQLAELGYVGFALDMFGEGKTHSTLTEARVTIEESLKSFDKSIVKFAKALEVLKSNKHCDPDRIAAIGYSYGGMIVLNMAKAGIDLKGVASFHGALNSEVKAEKGKCKAKILVCNGEADPAITQEHIENFKKEFDQAEIPYKFINYPGAKHAFTNPAATARGKELALSAMLEYNEKIDKESWAELESFLKEIFSI